MGNLAHNFVDLTGQRFERLIVIGRAGRNARNNATWNCLCDCGNNVVVVGTELRRKDARRTRSCGCFQRDAASKAGTLNRRHGRTKSRAYRTWNCMKARCYSPNDKSFHNYGGRGIRVCDRWKDSFENFYADMGDPPKGHTLERINNEGHYEPKNCRWASLKEQANNKRNNQMLSYNGKTQSLALWADEMHLHGVTLQTRINRLGWPVEKALTTPVRGK